VLIGSGREAAALTRLGAAAGIPVSSFLPSHGTAAKVVALCGSESAPNELELADLPIDPFTAVAFLLHDPVHETALIKAMMALKPFYIGILGSGRTHARRMSELRDAGLGEEDIQRLRGPIGLFGPTRTANDLAISILAEIADARLRLDG
jgi:xanthine dehydrogenase accessory factor